MTRVRDKINWHCHYKVEKFLADFPDHHNIPSDRVPYEVLEGEGNLLLNEGINELWTILCSAGGTKWNNANARIGVGNSNAAAAAAQTGLQGASTQINAMEAGFPTYGTSQLATFKSSFASGEANFAWEEWSIDNGAAGAKNLNRKVTSLGTKVAGTVWVLTVTVTLS